MAYVAVRFSFIHLIYKAYHNAGVENIPRDDAEGTYNIVNGFFENVLGLEWDGSDNTDEEDDDEGDEEEPAEDADHPAEHEVLAQ